MESFALDQLKEEVTIGQNQYGGIRGSGTNHLLCISAAIHSDVESHMSLENGKTITSQPTVLLLGFQFGSRPTVAAHVELIRKKFIARSWIIRHLKASGVPEDDIAKVFATTIRPAIEYAAPVYTPMLTN